MDEKVKEYIDSFDKPMADALSNLHEIISSTVPEAEDKIYYNLPTFMYKGILVVIAGFANHCSLITIKKETLAKFKERLKGYKISGATVQFTPEKPLPKDVVIDILKERIKDNEFEITQPKIAPKPKPKHQMSEFILSGLEQSGLVEDYYARPEYQQNDYIGWIESAKQQATKEKRLGQMLEELEVGGVYMKMPHPASKKN